MDNRILRVACLCSYFVIYDTNDRRRGNNSNSFYDGFVNNCGQPVSEFVNTKLQYVIDNILLLKRINSETTDQCVNSIDLIVMCYPAYMLMQS